METPPRRGRTRRARLLCRRLRAILVATYGGCDDGPVATTELRWGAPFTYDDLQDMPDDGHRYELIDGVLLVTPSPEIPHQACVGAVYRSLYAAREPDEIVFVAPLDYVVSSTTVLEPDVLVVRRESLGLRFVDRTPLLVVEVLSPSTRRIDLGTKRLAYEAAGVPTYWAVDPAEPSLTVFRLVGGRYEEEARVVGEEAYTAEAPFPVTIVPARLLDDLRG